MRIGIGLSLEPEPFKAGRDAVRQAKKTVPNPSLAIVFGSIAYDQKKVHEGICSEIDPDILIGGSSYAEITNAGVTKKSVAALLLDFGAITPVFSSALITGDAHRMGRQLTQRLCADRKGDLPLAFLFTSIDNGYENETLRAITSCLKGVPVVGGLQCGDYDLGLSHPKFWTNYQYIGPKVEKKGSRMVLLDLSKKDYRISFGFEHGCTPVAPPVTVTKAKGGDVYEVDGIPVFDYYRQFLGTEGGREFFEKQVQRYGFTLLMRGAYEGRSLLKMPVACNFKRGFISYFPAEDLQGRRVQLILASRKGLVEGARRAAVECRKALGGRKPSMLFVVSCCSRNAILHSKMDSEVDAIRSVMGADVPIFGFYSGGEIMPFLSRYAEVIDPKRMFSGSFYHTTTVGMMALAARERPEAVSVPKRIFADNDPQRAVQLLAKSEQILDQSESFLANLSRKSYLDGEALKKQNDVIYRYTPHDVYKQIGANAARGQYELSDAEFNGAFMFMDVKGFTSYSEKHGSKEVVRALNVLFEPATEIIYACGGDVDKYIGDCIFAAFKEPRDAVEAGKRILGLFKKLKRNPFSVRIGLNAGRAVRANVGSKDRREYTYIGDSVNLTQRLEANCTPGHLLLSESVFKRAKARFRSVEKKMITVKGKKDAVRVYDCAP